MDKRAVWVLIEADEDFFSKMTKNPTYENVREILRYPDDYDILDYCNKDDLKLNTD